MVLQFDFYSEFFINLLQRSLLLEEGNEKGASMVAKFVNSALSAAVGKCKVKTPCALRHPIFEAGPERGGRGIGGPLLVCC